MCDTANGQPNSEETQPAPTTINPRHPALSDEPPRDASSLPKAEEACQCVKLSRKHVLDPAFASMCPACFARAALKADGVREHVERVDAVEAANVGPVLTGERVRLVFDGDRCKVQRESDGLTYRSNGLWAEARHGHTWRREDGAAVTQDMRVHSGYVIDNAVSDSEAPWSPRTAAVAPANFTDPRQQIGTVFLDSIREKAIDSANAKVDEFCRGVAAAIGRLLGESALTSNGAGLTDDAKGVMYAMMDNGVRMAGGNWRFRDNSKTFGTLVERETRRITESIVAAAANIDPERVERGNLTRRVDAAHVRSGREGRVDAWMAEYRAWVNDGVKRGVLVDLTA